MSDETVKGGSEYPAVTYDDAIEYFSEKITSRSCELCGTGEWDILVQQNKQVPGFIVQETEQFGNVGVLPLVLLACKNCGNLKIFLERPIYDHLKQKRLRASQGGSSDV